MVDQLEIEVQLAHLLDEAAGELNGIAEQLRRNPFVAVEARLSEICCNLAELAKAGRMLKINQPELAHRLIHELSAGTE